jgi:hypothetical protein
MRVVVAPDKFKGSLTATEAVEAIAAGLRAARPGLEIVLTPLSALARTFAETLTATNRRDGPAVGGHPQVIAAPSCRGDLCSSNSSLRSPAASPSPR